MHGLLVVTPELMIQPYRSGIQLAKVDHANYLRPLEDIYNSSIATYFMSTASRNVAVNDATAILNGAGSISDLIGIDAHDLWDVEAANKMQANDKQVMNNECLQITDDSALRSSDESYLQMISFKLPWYEQEKVIGVFGMTMQLNTRSPGEFAMNLTRIIATGLINSSQLSTLQALPKATNGQVYLSKRELDILKLVVKNMTAKQIAERLFISKRTVENYIANIKLKANCNSKFELIEKFYWKLSKTDYT